MGKAVSSVAGGIAQDYFTRKGVSKAKAGYGQAIGTLGAGKQEALGFLQPYIDVGREALSPLSGLVAGRSFDAQTGEFDTLTPEERLALFEESPGYQFRLQEGQRALEASQAARGGLLSGRAALESLRYGQGLASNEYDSYINRLASLAGIGQASAGQAANIAGNVAGQIGQAQIGIGSLGLQRELARGQIFSDTIANVGENITPDPEQLAAVGQASPALMAMFSDKNLKENFEKIGRSPSGIPIYCFDYKDKKLGQYRYQGVLAQDVQKIKPEAVIRLKDGRLMVDYSKIDVNYRRVE